MHRDAPDLARGAVFHLAGVHPGPDLQAKVERLQEQLAAAMAVARAAFQAAYATPVKGPCDGCHGVKEAAILAALQRFWLCEAAAEVLDKLAQRLQAALDRLQQVPRDLGEVYELVCQFIRKRGKLPDTPGGSKARRPDGDRERGSLDHPVGRGHCRGDRRAGRPVGERERSRAMRHAIVCWFMTLTMIDGIDAAERLGLPADQDEDAERRHARAWFAAGVHHVVERYAADSGREGPGR